MGNLPRQAPDAIDPASSTMRTGQCRYVGHPDPLGAPTKLVLKVYAIAAERVSWVRVSIWAGPVRSWGETGSARPPAGGHHGALHVVGPQRRGRGPRANDR